MCGQSRVGQLGRNAVSKGQRATDQYGAGERRVVIDRMSAYLVRETRNGESPRHVVRHMLGLYQGVRGARQWRRELSDAAVLEREGAGVLMGAAQRVTPRAVLRAA